MQNLLRVALASSFLLALTSQLPTNAESSSKSELSRSVQEALNKKNSAHLTALMLVTQQGKSNLSKKYEDFLSKFPNAKWTIKEANSLKDGRNILKIDIKGENKLTNIKQSLEARQVIGIRIKNGKIYDPEVISEQTIIQTSQKPLSITLNIPKSVLTGTYYDFDVVLDKPLGDAMLIGGLIPISDNHIFRQTSPSIELSPLGGGGLFKSVKAPLSPGRQNWAAVIAHPDGIISITKRVQVVSDLSDI